MRTIMLITHINSNQHNLLKLMKINKMTIRDHQSFKLKSIFRINIPSGNKQDTLRHDNGY
jgi:hypothetical protein